MTGMREMTRQEWRAFLLERPRPGVLATVRADGRPHAAPVWFDLDGDDVVFTTWHASVKGRSLRRDGRATLCVDDEDPPFSFVVVEGVVSLTGDLDQLRPWARRIAARYMGEDRAGAYGARNAVEGELLVRFTPTRVVARAAIAE